jgi:uncharacterized protein (DUF58 family)
MSSRGLVFPLVPRRRLLGLTFGAIHGARRGIGVDVAGSRPYQPGDDRDSIDWAATARLSSARDTDEFVVREHYADEAPRVVIVADRRPDMALCSSELPWLRKDEAMRVASELIADSAADARGLVGYLDFAEGDPEPFWRPPASQTEHWAIQDRHLHHPTFNAPDDNIEQALDFLASHRRSVPPGTFLFVLSDFIVNPSREAWEAAVDRHWDIVPVVIQDPLWEQSFPPLDAIVLPLAGPDGRRRLVRLRPGESEEVRLEHERRREALLSGFQAMGMHPILISSTDTEAVYDGFLTWASEREFARGRAL